MKFCIIVESPIKYDMPYSAGIHGHIGNKQKKRKTKMEKILQKAEKAMKG